MSEVTEHNINQYKQNRISLIVHDLVHYVPEDITRKVMLKRGVNKWLYCRGKIINLKDELKSEVTEILGEMKEIKKQRKFLTEVLNKDIVNPEKFGYHKNCKRELYKLCNRYNKLVGKLDATSTIKEKIREICHLSRWQFPK